jgi:hypothetical protein
VTRLAKDYDGRKNMMKNFPMLLNNLFSLLISFPIAMQQGMKIGLLFEGRVS